MFMPVLKLNYFFLKREGGVMNGDIVKIRQKLKIQLPIIIFFLYFKDIKIHERIKICIWSVFCNFS